MGRLDSRASGPKPSAGRLGLEGHAPFRPGFTDDPVDYAAALRDRRRILIEEVPGVPLRRRKQPWHRAAPHSSGANYVPFATEIPFGLWIVSLVPNGDEERSGRTWGQRR
ncbi:hypothetical protein ACIP96_35355 [Streptomyces nigra]|uniref:hypothetical protein n=1 Tax=Streptomyces nigra TaxID=1827580 RepID=UPI00382142D4